MTHNSFLASVAAFHARLATTNLSNQFFAALTSTFLLATIFFAAFIDATFWNLDLRFDYDAFFLLHNIVEIGGNSVAEANTSDLSTNWLADLRDLWFATIDSTEFYICDCSLVPSKWILSNASSHLCWCQLI